MAFSTVQARRLFSRARPLKVLGVLASAALLLALQGTALHRQSLVWDAPYHLLAGHQSLRYGTNSLNLEHPPLVKLIAAAPLVYRSPPLAPPISVSEALTTAKGIFDHPKTARRGRVGGRYLVLAFFGIPLLILCFWLGSEVGDRSVGFVLLFSVGLSFNVVPFLTLIGTDAAVAVAYLFTVCSAIVFFRRPTALRALGLGLGLGLALATKFSGVLLIPAVLTSLVLGSWGAGQRSRPLLSFARNVSVTFITAIFLVWLTYSLANASYDPAVGRQSIRDYTQNNGTVIVEDRLRPHTDRLLALERISPPLAQWLTGFLSIRAQNAIGVYPSYAFGAVSSEGRWWYFPAVLLVKTPLLLLIAAVGSTIWIFRRKNFSGSIDWKVVLIVVIVTGTYLGVAITSNYNLGIRHLLPVLPLLYLPGAIWASRKKWRVCLLTTGLALEALALTPLWMSATNTWWLGKSNPTRLALSDSNFEYGQNLLNLGAAVKERGIDRLRVIHPVLGEHELGFYFPDAALVRPGSEIEPGWYAMSAMLEQYIPAILRASPAEVYSYSAYRSLLEGYRKLWEQVRTGEDHGYIAGTFHLYRLTESAVAELRRGPRGLEAEQLGPGVGPHSSNRGYATLDLQSPKSPTHPGHRIEIGR